MQKLDVKNRSIEYLIAFVYTLLTLLIIYLSFGLYLESSDKVVAQVLYGALAPPPYPVWFNEDHFVQIPVLAFLSTLFPKTPIYGIWFLGIMALYTWLWFLLFLRLTTLYIGKLNIWSVSIASTIVWVLLGPSLMYAYFMRASILLCAVSLLYYIYYYSFYNKKISVFFLLFALGCSMRVSTGAMVLVVFTLFAFLRFKDLNKTINLLVWPWLIALTFLSVVFVNKWFFGHDSQKIEQTAEYAILDKQAIKPLSEMKTAQDSMRYKGVVSYFLILDTNQVSLNFVESIVDKSKFNFWGVSNYDFQHFNEVTAEFVIKYKPLILLLYIFLLILLMGQPIRSWRDMFVLHTVGWGIVVFITLKVNMYSYFLEPWMAMLFGLSIFFLLPHSKKAHVWKKICLTFILLCACYNIKESLSKIAIQERVNNKLSESYLSRMDSFPGDIIPIYWFFEIEYLPTPLFNRSNAKILDNGIHLSIPFVAYYPFAQKRCKDKLGFNYLDWREMNSTLSAKHDRVRLLMDDEFAIFLGEYFDTLYGLRFELIRDESIPEIVPGVYAFKLNL